MSRVLPKSLASLAFIMHIYSYYYHTVFTHNLGQNSKLYHTFILSNSRPSSHLSSSFTQILNSTHHIEFFLKWSQESWTGCSFFSHHTSLSYFYILQELYKLSTHFLTLNWYCSVFQSGIHAFIPMFSDFH